MTNYTDGTPIPETRSALNGGGVRDLLMKVIDAHAQRALWERIAAGDDSKHAAVAAEMLADLPEVTALDAVAAATELARVLTGRRWIDIMHARADGASWAEVGDAMGVSAEEARAWYAAKIARQAKCVGDVHDAAEAEAAL